MARSLVALLATRAAASRAMDDDRVAGVYAAPGPRAQGDEATGEPVLAADLLDDDVGARLADDGRVSDVRLGHGHAGDDEPGDGGDGGRGGLN